VKTSSLFVFSVRRIGELAHALKWPFQNREAISVSQIAGIIFSLDLLRHERFDTGRGAGALRDFLVCFDENLEFSL